MTHAAGCRQHALDVWPEIRRRAHGEIGIQRVVRERGKIGELRNGAVSIHVAHRAECEVHGQLGIWELLPCCAGDLAYQFRVASDLAGARGGLHL